MKFNVGLRFGQIIKMAREEREWSQRDLSNATGISQSTIAKLELGTRIVSDRVKLRALAEALELPYTEILRAVSAERLPSKRLSLVYPRLMRVLTRAIFSLTETQQQETVGRIEHRLKSLNENPAKIGENLALFLSGKLALDEEPNNGLRPLSHYIADWGTEIEEW